MGWETWTLFVMTEAVLSLIPGPAVLFVLATGMLRGTGPSVWANAGILSANAIYFALSATSVSALLLANYQVFFLIKGIGAAYLLYLAVKCWWPGGSLLQPPAPTARSGSGWRIWKDGLALQGANPQAILFTTATLPQFVNPHGDVVMQVLIFGFSSVAVEFCILFAYGHLAGRVYSTAANPVFELWVNRLAGVMLVCAAVGVSLLNQN